MLFKDAITKENLLKYYVKSETNALYIQGIEELKKQGFEVAYSGGNCATHSGDTVPLIPEVIVPLFMMLTSLKKMSDGRTKNKHHGIKAINTFKKRRI